MMMVKTEGTEVGKSKKGKSTNKATSSALTVLKRATSSLNVHMINQKRLQ